MDNDGQRVLPTRSSLANDLIEAALAAPDTTRVRQQLGATAQSSAVEIARAPGSLPRVLAAALCAGLERSLLYVAPDIRSAERARDDMRSLLGEQAVALLPPRYAIPYDPFQQDQRFDERADAFERLLQLEEPSILVAVPASLVERQHELEVHRHAMVRLALGDDIDREALALVFGEAGMRRENRVEEPGHFALRGSVIDLYPPSAEAPVRLELWGDEISEMRSFDPVTQRSLEPLAETTFYAGEAERLEGGQGLWDLLPDDAFAFVDDPDLIEAGLERQWEEIDYQFEKRKDLELDRRTSRPDELYLRPAQVQAGLAGLTRVIHRGSASATAGAISFEGRTHESFLGDLDRLVGSLRTQKQKRLESFVLCDRESQVDRLLELLEDHGAGGAMPRIGAAPLHEGFSWPSANLVVMTDHQIFGRPKRSGPFRRGRRRGDLTSALNQFTKGDLVVHTEFGIGRYHGLKTIDVRGTERECVQIEYRDNVKVYVRLDQFSKLQKYQGTEGAEPTLSKIGGREWARSRKKTEEAVEQLAEEILEIYAKRQVEGGHAFRADTPWQREMEAAFEFEDTPDQVVTATQIKQDMEKPVAMDRLLVGDVGFGKTEVAIRAAFKALQDSKQVSVLVPTTILAAQHHATFVERLRRYPVRVEVLSRFQGRKKQKQVVEGLADGSVDLVIGTHRLLSQDIHFKDLGLLVVDEEHRFGVKHKERLKEFRVSVDVLSMSATPIPRTLHMALSGARDMSMISTPPQDRLPIETEVAAFDERTIREAILREVARGGQVYFLHNRVETIHSVAAMIEGLLGETIKVGVAHGQMKERELEMIMDDFLHERFQVLVCTMIIESGLDIPNVNTLIVNRADRFGLAQLYQLRGRIGRSHRQAYAWLLTPPRSTLAADARRRLETIAEHTRLGSGFQIAMRDLEIRGAGNLLGSQQSGFINAVGFELYTQMLGEAVQKLSDEGVAELPDAPALTRDPRDIKVDVPVDAMLPADYVADASERVELYRRLSRSRTASEVDSLREELRDRFGPLPELAQHLLEIVGLQARGARAGAERVDIHPEVAFIQFHDEWGGERFEELLGEMLSAMDDFPVELRGAGPLGLRLDLADQEDWPARWTRLREVFDSMPELRP